MSLIEVSEFRGRITSTDIAGPWGKELGAHFEVHGRDGFVTNVAVGEDGVFAASIPPGSYCFKFSSPGFRSYFGEVRVDRRATKHEIILPVSIIE